MTTQRDFAADVVERLTGAGFSALWAGGCVRDELLGRTPKDYDIATNARPEQVREIFGRRRTLAVGESFGVIVVLGPKSAGQIEVATFRADGEYLDGRRPESVQFCSAEEDAKRRDFTINGMFFDPLKEQVLDYVGGQNDLKAGILRAIGDPVARMTEDKLRMLRAVRFAATFDFALDESTADAVRSMADQISVVSAERIAQELRRMLAHSNRDRAMQLCRDVELLLQILPESEVILGDAEWSSTLTGLRRLGANGASDVEFPVAFALLLTSIATAQGHDGRQAARRCEEIGKRLKLSNREIDHVVWILRHRDLLTCALQRSDAELKRVLSQPHGRDLIEVMRAWDEGCGRTPDDSEFCRAYLEKTPHAELNPPPLLTGDDLISAGLRPGPQFKEILEAVRDAQLNGEISTHDAACELAKRLAR